MKGDFSFEKDPERRRILQKLKAKGMSFGGGTDMDIEQLRNMEKVRAMPIPVAARRVTGALATVFV